MKRPQAKLTTVSALKSMAVFPGQWCFYRQTRNWKTRQWSCVKARLTDEQLTAITNASDDASKRKHRWRKITNEKLALKKKKWDKAGWDYAIWNMWEYIMTKRLDKQGRPLWTCEMFKIKRSVYMTYYLVCHRINYSIQGVV